MQPVIYDVAVSADGFISGPAGDISKFPHEGEIVDDYFERLKTYPCAIMGRATYEFGYGFGLKPGDNPYPHMKTIVFSKSIDLPEEADVIVTRDDAAEHILSLKQSCEGPIYLCGGGQFAGSLLSFGLIDRLRLKRAPVFLGDGVRLFGDQSQARDAILMDSKLYPNGALYQEFDLQAAVTQS
ncbi:MAG: dihydrofolate reductase family protein [Pseudomonadota bacterium]